MSGTYNIFKSEVMKKSIDLSSDTLRIALMNESHVFDPSSSVNTKWSDVSSNEVIGIGYNPDGEILTGTNVLPDNTNNRGYLTANDVIWSDSTITAYHAVIYDDTTDPKYLICSISFEEAKTSDGGIFSIQWDSNGVLAIT
jgi:hypothetical protein